MSRILLALSPLAILAAVMLSGCGGGVELEEGQYHLTFEKDGGLLFRGLVDDGEFEDEFDVDLDDDHDRIRDDLVDFFEDRQDVEVEIRTLEIRDKTVELVLYVEDSDDLFGLEIADTLEDVVDDNFGGDWERFVDNMDPETYRDGRGESVDEDELEDKYQEYLALRVRGDDEGVFYTVPGGIALTCEIDYEKIGGNTIFVEPGEHGWIVFKP